LIITVSSGDILPALENTELALPRKVGVIEEGYNFVGVYEVLIE
jgi:hypothetical protein